MANIKGQCRMGPEETIQKSLQEVSAKHRNNYEGIMRHELIPTVSVYIGPAVYARWAQVGGVFGSRCQTLT